MWVMLVNEVHHCGCRLLQHVSSLFGLGESGRNELAAIWIDLPSEVQQWRACQVMHCLRCNLSPGEEGQKDTLAPSDRIG